MELQGKNILFITTKELSYIRNTQEIKIISKQAEKLKIIGCEHKSYISRLLHVYLSIIFSNPKHIDSVFIGFSPQLVLPIFFWKWRHKEIIIDFFISIYDTFVDDRKKVPKESLVAGFMKWIDRFTLQKANRVITDTKEHGKYFCEEFLIDQEKIRTVYLEANREIYFPQLVEKEGKWKDKYLVLYFGSILPCQGIEVILKAIDILKDNKKIQFLIIGPIKDLKERENLEHIPWVSQTELAKYIAMSDLCLAGHFNKDIGKARRTIPGKAYIYEAMNKKIILGDNLANREVFIEDERHFFVEMGNAELLAKIIQNISSG